MQGSSHKSSASQIDQVKIYTFGTPMAHRGYHARMIVYCCHDLIFATKIHGTAEALGLPCRPARGLDALQKRLDQIDDGKPCGPVAAVIVDLTLGETALELIDLAKRHDPAVTVVAFAPHVEVQQLEAAEKRGADRVMPRGAFSAQLPDLLTSLAGNVVDPAD